VDAAAKAIVLEDDTTEPYDTLSLALGPVPAGLDVPGVSRTVAVCPDGRARHILPAIAEARTAAGSRTMAVAVVGAGASGFEVACALRARLQRETPGASVMVVDASDEVMKDQGPKARRLALSMLERRRIGVALGARVVEVTSRGLCLASGAVAPADFVIWCTGAAPPTAISGSGLALDEAGFAAVDAALRSKSHPDVFVAGGAVSMREGRVLAHNLAVACGSVPGKTFKSYQRRLRAPTLLNAGDGMALLSFGAVAREARWAMRLKDRLDRRWVERFQRLERTTASSA
jgi:selenide,water dikinase